MYLRVQSSPHGERNNKKSTHKWQTLPVCNRANKTYVLSAKTISITDISNSSRLHISISIPMKTNMFSKIGQMNSFEMALLIERSQTIHQIQGKYATYKKKKNGIEQKQCASSQYNANKQTQKHPLFPRVIFWQVFFCCCALVMPPWIYAMVVVVATVNGCSPILCSFFIC